MEQSNNITVANLNGDTICAVATPAGQGAIAVIRVSGAGAFGICDTIFSAANRSRAIATAPAGSVIFGNIADNGKIIDEVLVTLFRAPHSYTGENSVEISCHGSSFIRQQIISLLIDKGCRMAMPGEFTQRAFLNGKMDLAQAEAVADIIAAESAAAHKLALSQLKGGFSSELNRLRTGLLDFASLIELELDFSEEDVEFADRTQLYRLIEHIETVTRKLTDSFSTGNALKNGIPVAIVGETNVGKSTLLNRLLNEERAIVSDIHGTTRDTIEEVMTLGGVQFRFIDTAGIRDTRDKIESLGIERTFHKMEQATIVLPVLDSTREPDELAGFTADMIAKTEGKQRIFIINKADLLSAEKQERIAQLPALAGERYCFLSAKYGQGYNTLLQALIDAANIPEISSEDITVTNIRHFEALRNAHEAILRVIAGLTSGLSGDFLSQDIREAIYHLGSITGGSITNDEILGNIFSKFCIGK
jgi:tRNA modification GTPase